MVKLAPKIYNILLQLLPTGLATLSAISDGMQYGWSAPAIPILKSKSSPISISQADEFWLEASFLLTGVVTMPIIIYWVHSFGPKKSILLGSFFSLLSWTILALATNIRHLYLGRVLVGLGADICIISILLYVTEIAGPEIRGFLGGSNYLLTMVGILVIYSTVPYDLLLLPALIAGTLLTVQLLFLPLMPESPFFLVRQGKTEEAKQSLARLRLVPNDGELQDIINTVQQQKSYKSGYLEVMKRNKKCLVIETVLIFYQHFSGFNSILMNLHSIMEAAESEFLTPSKMGVLFSSIMVLATALCMLTVDKFGRKHLLIVSQLFTALSLLMVAVFFAYNLVEYKWLLPMALIVYLVAFKLGLGMLPEILITELFPLDVRAKALAFGEILYNLFGCVSLWVYHYLGSNFGISVPFFVFAAVLFSGLFFIYFVVPETKGKSFGEIQNLLSK